MDKPDRNDLRQAARQQQFLDVIDRDEAETRFRRHLQLEPIGCEIVPVTRALNRILAESIQSTVDVPAFDRSNVDGFAVRSADTHGATEESPRMLRLNPDVLSPGVAPQAEVGAGTATTIATGGVLPRGSDAVVMVEDTDLLGTEEQPELEVRRAVSPGQSVAFAGTDISRGETILRRGSTLTSREIGVLAATGRADVPVFSKPRVAILSTGDEIIAPGEPPTPGSVYDSNAAILGAAVEELGGTPIYLGIVGDEEGQLANALARGLSEAHLVLLSGGTSKGAGDLSYRTVAELTDPGIVAHGVALKPGKPICLAVTDGKPVVILPGFPTSAIFTFHEFVAPVIRAWAGKELDIAPATIEATLPLTINSDRGRTEYLLVSLVRDANTWSAYPMGKGSGSVTTFSHADGFITISAQQERLEESSRVDVQLLGAATQPADFISIGSHCVGLDLLCGRLQSQGLAVKQLNVGSRGGLTAARRGECDVAGIHLLDPETDEYNAPFLDESLSLIPGYRRRQGFVFRIDDERFADVTADNFVERVTQRGDCRMVNRNAGSGTRVLIDELLTGVPEPSGFPVQAKSHNAVAAAVVQGRADWGLAIETVATEYELGFVPLRDEHYDFVVPRNRLDRAPVQAFLALLRDVAVRSDLERLGFAMAE